MLVKQTATTTGQTVLASRVLRCLFYCLTWGHPRRYQRRLGWGDAFWAAALRRRVRGYHRGWIDELA